MKTSHRVLVGALAAGLITTLIGTSTANAAPGDIAVAAGTLNWDGGTAPVLSTFTSITLNGRAQLVAASLSPFAVVDATGSSAGWNVQFGIADLVNGSGTIVKANVGMPAPTVTNVATNAPAAGMTLSALAAGGPTKIVSASAVVTSNGTFIVSPGLVTVVVPPDALTGTYTTTVTVTINSGP